MAPNLSLVQVELDAVTMEVREQGGLEVHRVVEAEVRSETSGARQEVAQECQLHGEDGVGVGVDRWQRGDDGPLFGCEAVVQAQGAADPTGAVLELHEVGEEADGHASPDDGTDPLASGGDDRVQT